ncbi:DNA repair protein SWI5 homolog [Aedes aegypti]|uniref:DNA repair protein SWI5 homolog n=1 Tax=Aedes aegypti TaxID=7159 RepID=A0A6I8TSE5_AEDAE|nr:DNA repair protein SWI5 homolog [Aedes aegypti]
MSSTPSKNMTKEADKGSSPSRDASERDKTELMDMMHRYNDIKDATQKVLGALAVMEGATVKEMHVRYNLPLDS